RPHGSCFSIVPPRLSISSRVRVTISSWRSSGSSGSSMSSTSYAVIVPEPPLFPRSSGLAGRRRPGERTRWRGRKRAEGSTGLGRSRVALVAGGAAAAAVIAYGLVRRKPPVVADLQAPEGPDPRAEALREKLAVSRELAAERDTFEAGETTVDTADIEAAA